MKRTFTYHIDEDLCINCGSCRRFCPVDTIPYTNLQHQIEMAGCTGCTICYAVCPVDAVEVTDPHAAGGRVILDAAAMERVRVRTWVKGPFYQHKRRLAERASQRSAKSSTERKAGTTPNNPTGG
jgi:ferredoxin